MNADPRADAVALVVVDRAKGCQLMAQDSVFAVIDEFYDAVAGVRPAVHDARWGTTTMEIALALIASARTGREVCLSAPAADAHAVVVPPLP